MAGHHERPGADMAGLAGSGKFGRSRRREVLGPGESPEGEGIRVSAGEGELVILEIQPPGKKKMDGGAFARGYPCRPGLVLGESA